MMRQSQANFVLFPQRKRLCLWLLLAVAVYVGQSAHAYAQEAADQVETGAQEAVALPPAPPPQPATLQAANASASSAEAECFPGCRANFMCVEGQCISECNPVCGEGEQCSAGQCLPIVVAPVAAPVPIEAIPDGVHTHDGFMLRLTMGLGYGAGGGTTNGVGITSPGAPASVNEKFSISGAAGAFSIDVGGNMARNLIIHGRIGGVALANPDFSSNVSTFSGLDTSATIVLVGGGLTYYFMPMNLYLTGILGISSADLSVDDISGSSNGAFGMNFDVGKEWWVSSNWGLGVAVRGWLSNVVLDTGSELQAAGVSHQFMFAAFQLLFSATYQ